MSTFFKTRHLRVNTSTMLPTDGPFSAADFLIDDRFVDHQLSPTPRSTAFWTSWLQAHPHRHPAYQQAVALLVAVRLGLQPYAQLYLSDELIHQLWMRIQQTNIDQSGSAVRSKPIAPPKWVIAASTLLLVGIGLWWYLKVTPSLYEQRRASLAKPIIEKINTSQHPQAIRLPDKSLVFLGPHSQLSYSATFNQRNRRVCLTGEARFAVTKNVKKPFLVLANELITQVIGTQFVVRAFAQEAQLQVQVQTGQVAVFRDQLIQPLPQQPGVLLRPNQQVIFDRQTQQFNKRLVDNPQLVTAHAAGPHRKLFLYTETPIEQVFGELSQAYGVIIQFNREALAHCQLTASLKDESFQQKLAIICKTIGASYVLLDGQVVINSGGCQ